MASHQLESFSCGEENLDKWVREKVQKDCACGACRAHFCLDSSNEIVAFFTLSGASVKPVSLPNKHRGGIGGDIPAVLIGRLGVRSNLRGNGYGVDVLNHALKMACEASNVIGFRLITLEAKNENLVAWYKSYGFASLPGNRLKMVMAIKEARAIISSHGAGYYMF